MAEINYFSGLIRTDLVISMPTNLQMLLGLLDTTCKYPQIFFLQIYSRYNKFYMLCSVNCCCKAVSASPISFIHLFVPLVLSNIPCVLLSKPFSLQRDSEESGDLSPSLSHTHTSCALNFFPPPHQLENWTWMATFTASVLVVPLKWCIPLCIPWKLTWLWHCSCDQE